MVTCRKSIGLLVCLALVFGSVPGCKPIPTGPESVGGLLDRTYTNEEWGFSITAPPDSAWSLSASRFIAAQESNGLSPVQVLLRRSNPSLAWRPTMLISPFGRLDGEELQGAVTSFETQVMQEFANYNAQGQKASGLVGGVETVEWFFRAREPQSGIHTFNNRFLCVVFVRSDQVYRVVCSAQQGSFPETDFRSILATFEFSPR